MNLFPFLLEGKGGNLTLASPTPPLPCSSSPGPQSNSSQVADVDSRSLATLLLLRQIQLEDMRKEKEGVVRPLPTPTIYQMQQVGQGVRVGVGWRRHAYREELRVGHDVCGVGRGHKLKSSRGRGTKGARVTNARCRLLSEGT